MLYVCGERRYCPMEYLIIFVGAVAAAILIFDLMSALTQSALVGGQDRLSYGPSNDVDRTLAIRKRSALDAVLIAVWPERFDPDRATSIPDVVDLLRRAGYPYETPGEFYAAAVRDFAMFLIVGAALAAVMTIFDMGLVGPIIAAMFIFLGLRRPYSRLKMLTKKRAEGMVSNMLIGLTVLETLVTNQVGVEEALRAVGKLGGPFCNLMALLVAQKTIREDPEQAIHVVQQHLPDPNNMEMQLFLGDIRAEFTSQGSGNLSQSIRTLRESVHRTMVENTESRAALVRQRAGLFGVLAVLGLVLTIVLPYMGVAF